MSIFLWRKYFKNHKFGREIDFWERHVSVEKDDSVASNYVTLQTSPSGDGGVEFVTLDDFFVADPAAVYEQEPILKNLQFRPSDFRTKFVRKFWTNFLSKTTHADVTIKGKKILDSKIFLSRKS
jgi:hypothetical protein